MEKYIKTSDFQQNLKLIFESVFNDVGLYTVIVPQTKILQKCGIEFPPHDTPGVAVFRVAVVQVAVVQVAVVLGGSCSIGGSFPVSSCPGGSCSRWRLS